MEMKLSFCLFLYFNKSRILYQHRSINKNHRAFKESLKLFHYCYCLSMKDGGMKDNEEETAKKSTAKVGKEGLFPICTSL